jgi:hypothetical protein
MALGRQPNGRFGPGNPGGPGRPPVAAERYQADLQKVVGTRAFRRLVKVILGKAIDGNPVFARMLLHYLLPRPLERVEFQDVTEETEFRVAGKTREEIIRDMIKRLGGTPPPATGDPRPPEAGMLRDD